MTTPNDKYLEQQILERQSEALKKNLTDKVETAISFLAGDQNRKVGIGWNGASVDSSNVLECNQDLTLRTHGGCDGYGGSNFDYYEVVYKGKLVFKGGIAYQTWYKERVYPKGQIVEYEDTLLDCSKKKKMIRRKNDSYIEDIKVYCPGQDWEQLLDKFYKEGLKIKIKKEEQKREEEKKKEEERIKKLKESFDIT